MTSIRADGLTRHAAAFAGGAAVGVLGGLVGLGGGEFRLPLLMVAFGFIALQAVILNKAMSLVVVASALVFRSGTVLPSEVVAHRMIVANLLAGSLVGAWLAAGWAVQWNAATLQRVIAVLLAFIALMLLIPHGPGTGRPALEGA